MWTLSLIFALLTPAPHFLPVQVGGFETEEACDIAAEYVGAKTLERLAMRGVATIPGFAHKCIETPTETEENEGPNA
jgi:hypothetical protein